MITIMFTAAPDRSILEAEFQEYCSKFKTKPMLVLAHREMAYEFPEQKSTKTRIQGVRIVSLEELIELHGNQLGYKEEEE